MVKPFVGVRSPELISSQTFEIQPHIKFGNLSTQHFTQQMRVESGVKVRC
jgi:hypothetical protein